MTLSSLPAELQYNFLSRLNERDFASVASTCKHFKAFSTDPQHKFPRITSKIYKNIIEGKYFLTRIPAQSFRSEEVLFVENGNPVIKVINESEKLDARTTFNVVHRIRRGNINFHYQFPLCSKELQINEVKYTLSKGSLYGGDELISRNVLDFACLNGIILYSTDKGLFRFSPAAFKSERIKKTPYTKLGVDEKNGIICGFIKDSIDKIDYSHPDARINEEDTAFYSVKAKIVKVIATFFKEIKTFVVQNFDWKVTLFVAVFGSIAGLFFGVALASNAAEIFIMTGLFILIELVVFSMMAAFEVLKHAFSKAAEVALEPLS